MAGTTIKITITDEDGLLLDEYEIEDIEEFDLSKRMARACLADEFLIALESARSALDES